MPTAFSLRVTLIVPAANAAAFATWTNNNLGANTVQPHLGPPLNASGLAADPVTHRWCSVALGDIDARKILFRLCDLAGQSKPAQATWAGWTGAQRRAWLHSVQAALLAGWGVRVNLAPNDGPWDSPAAELAALNLQRVREDGS